MWGAELVSASSVLFDSSVGFIFIIHYIPTQIDGYLANNQEHWKFPQRPLVFHCIAHNHGFHDLHDILPHTLKQGGKLDNKNKEMAQTKTIIYLWSHDSHRLMDIQFLYLAFQTDFVPTIES